MAKVTVLPPQAEPAKLTAQQRPDSLGEHMRAFMNKNNAKGFLQDEDNELGEDTVGGILLEVMFGPGMTLREVNRLIDQLRVMTKGAMSARTANAVVVNALGYKHMDDVASKVGSLKFNVFIPNISDTTHLQKMYFARVHDRTGQSDTSVKAFKEPSLRQIQHLLDPIKYGHITDSLRNVEAVRAYRADGHPLDVVHATPHNTTSPFVKKLAVKLADHQQIDLLFNVERLEVGLGESILQQDLLIELGISFCNHNHRQTESRSAGRSLVFNNCGLDETEYFNRKLKFQASL